MRIKTRLSERGKTLIGVVHLLPLPGSALSTRSLAEVRRDALRDARAYFDHGCDAVIVENFGDVPFHKDCVPPHVVAAMTAIAVAVKEISGDRFVGVNVLRNAALDALGIAVGAELDFLRVNVLASVSVADQGLIEGDAARLMRQRRHLAPDVAVFADLRVKHATPLKEGELEIEVEELTRRALADAVLVTGKTTGRAPEVDHLDAVIAAAGGAPVLVASGVNTANVSRFSAANGFIVGSSLKVDGRIDAPVDPARVAALRKAIDDSAVAGSRPSGS